MKTLTTGEEKNWVEALDGILFAHRTAKHNSTGYSPFYLLYGRHPRLPVDVTLPEDTDIGFEDELNSEHVTNVSRAMQVIREATQDKAKNNIEKSQEKQRKHYNKRHSTKDELKEGDKVLLKNLKRADRKGGKETCPWLGPYAIVKVNDNSTCRLSSETGELKKTQHMCNLKRFLDRTTQDFSTIEEDITEQGSCQTVDAKRVWIVSPRLTFNEKSILENNELLTDSIIDAAQAILQDQYTTINFQTPLLSQSTGFISTEMKSVQIHFDEIRGHWVTSTDTRNRVDYADSLYNGELSASIRRQLLNRYSHLIQNGALEVYVLPVQRQCNAIDCGLHAVANAVEFVAEDGNPTAQFELKAMRKHLVQCFESSIFTPFPKNPKRRRGRPEKTNKVIISL